MAPVPLIWRGEADITPAVKYCRFCISKGGWAMKVSGTSGKNIPAGQMNLAQGTDAVSKSLQKQIVNAQKALQELSANKEMGMEEKMQRRKELQQQINELTNQLRQHQIELRRERQQAKKTSGEEAPAKQQTQEQPGSGMSEPGMKALVSADAALGQAGTYGNVSTHLKGEARALQGEIKLDKQRGQEVGKKEGKLAKIEKRIQKATSSQLSVLEGANQKLREASKKDREEKTGQKEEKTDRQKEKDRESVNLYL